MACISSHINLRVGRRNVITSGDDRITLLTAHQALAGNLTVRLLLPYAGFNVGITDDSRNCAVIIAVCFSIWVFVATECYSAFHAISINIANYVSMAHDCC